MGKRDGYVCKTCGFVLPKEDAVVFGYDSQSSLSRAIKEHKSTKVPTRKF